MNKFFFNLETNVSNLQDLTMLRGKPGRRAIVGGRYYYWDNADQEWKIEGGLPYKYYSCQVNQMGTNNAWDNVLGNHTFDDYITWDRLTTGVYRGTLEAAFPEYRTQFFYSSFSIQANASPGGFAFRFVDRADDDTIIVHQYDSNLQSIDGLHDFDLEIRVYDSNQLRD